MADSDAETIRAVQSGEVERYAELVDKYQGPALKLAYSFLGNYEDARDVSQEAFVHAYQALSRFRGGARFSTWLYRIVVNACKDVHKRRARQPLVTARVGTPPADDEAAASLFVDVADPGASPQDQLAARELGRRLSAAIGTLPLQQRTAFLLHRVHGLSLEEAAGIMACRVGTVKSHVFRATATLRTQLQPWLAQEEP
jgi:RNA polymerase sigma-70 factor (ECF subfamily)